MEILREKNYESGENISADACKILIIKSIIPVIHHVK